MSKRPVIEYIETSSKYIDILDKQAEHYYEQCKLLKSENKKLKEGYKIEEVHDSTEQKLLEAALKKLSKVEENINRRST